MKVSQNKQIEKKKTEIEKVYCWKSLIKLKAKTVEILNALFLVANLVLLYSEIFLSANLSKLLQDVLLAESVAKVLFSCVQSDTHSLWDERDAWNAFVPSTAIVRMPERPMTDTLQITAKLAVLTLSNQASPPKIRHHRTRRMNGKILWKH